MGIAPVSLLPESTQVFLSYKNPITDDTPVGSLSDPINSGARQVERWGNNLLDKDQYKNGKTQSLYRLNPVGMQNGEFSLHQTTKLNNSIWNPLKLEGYNTDVLSAGNKIKPNEPALVKALGANLKVLTWNGDGTAHNLMQDYLSYTSPDGTTLLDWRPKETTVGRDNNSSKWATHTFEIGADAVKRSLFRIQSNGADLLTVDKNDIKMFKPLTITGDLNVTGNETLTGNIHVTGTSALDGAITGNSTLHIVGASTLDSTLHIVGAGTLDSTLSVAGATTLSSTLHLVGAATLDSNLTVAGGTTLSQTLHTVGNVQLDGTLTANGASLLKGAITGNSTALFKGAVTVGDHTTQASVKVDAAGVNGAIFILAQDGTDLWYIQKPGSQSYFSISDVAGNREQVRFATGASITAALTRFFTSVQFDTNIGFFGTTPVAIATVNGSRGGNVALQSLLSALSSYGLITDSTTA